jgi:hypothetical protein
MNPIKNYFDPLHGDSDMRIQIFLEEAIFGVNTLTN